MSAKAKCIIFGSSHFSKKRNFPKELKSAIASHPNNLTNRFYEPLITAVSGGTLSNAITESVIKAMDQCTEEKVDCLVVMNFGDNDIRQGLIKEMVVINLVETMKRIATHTSVFVKLAIVGLVPSPRTHEETAKWFEKVSNVLVYP
jgi:hypothetical protein